ncbi:hypothetical protein F4780DRAFT_372732 [Xylariomycetidae sp. FL0641]|nr:hypothetical protein F4780DRAFT_372732 [Xylariomycetidae sp. FL0641]
MAGYGGNDGGLQSMYARLQAARNAQQENETANANDLHSRFAYNQGNSSSQPYYGQSIDSPLAGLDDFPPPAAPTPPSNFGHSHHSTAGMSGLGPIGSNMPSKAATKADQSSNLLNLLKFSKGQNQNAQYSHQPSPSTHPHAHIASFEQSPHPQSAADPTTIHAPVPMPADPQGLLATLMKGSMQNENMHGRHEPQTSNEQHESSWNQNTGPSMDTQQLLLNLLHRPKPAQNDPPSAHDAASAAEMTPQSHDSTPLPFKFGSKDNVESPPAKFEYQSPMSQNQDGSRATRFDYTNPFEEFAAAKPSKSPTADKSAAKSSVPAEAPAATDMRPSPTSPSLSPNHKRLKPSSYKEPQYNYPGRKPETVSEAISDLAGKADLEAREALARAEEGEVQARIAEELDDMFQAQTDAEFREAAEAAAKDIKAELEKSENAGAIEKRYSPEIAEAIRDIVEDAAQGPVADNWESAEADEIVVIEEQPSPVKVYNFPMKPWISITMQETDEPRPQFRDDVVTGIAKLRKEFDQIDRNLVAATESYMVYSMLKAGLRVIRQEDGNDAKVFTDTKDRIFNVAVSSSTSDSNFIPMECAIGTGVSGTVYYVQIKSGDDDHSEDAHPEQYGFKLLPLNTQEGDAPGGVLKTRARTSSTHPEYFAVGRGKTINIVWPAYVMQNNVFKHGHDRTVDTDRLFKECALRINTGKAGKDFTFSYDDSAIVSLDKSGRVKFWDVRDLTAADESSDYRFPMPANTGLEVKEPLLTFNTIAEGDKAWPTSVLLLDKQRPYQRRSALRYMIVGMKQNHTLQLWDLALGKPVQEFNLPHPNDSDAVCSVMYHPPTGMIVVGHPTRNSIYFLHLSAPKYAIKGLSQVEYIQKLVAKDPSIPEPDSTAVISGVREYSFANKGQLRSLDILTNPTNLSHSDEATLFDLYAMHSKGVTTLAVKQHELGWSKDNQIILGVDATEIGLAKTAKIRELPNALVTETVVTEEPALPIRIINRSSAREPSLSQNTGLHSDHEQPKKAAENVQLNVQPDRKEAEIPVTPINQLDKSEKKARKKKEKAAAAAAAAAEKLAVENGQSNGTRSLSPRAGPVSSKNGSVPSLQSTVSSDFVQSAVQQISSAVDEKLSVISGEFKDYRSKVDAEFRSRDKTFNKSQRDLLETVSKILNENTQNVLARTISDQFKDSVVPELSILIAKMIESQIDAKIGGKVSHSIQNQMQKSLPNAVIQALQKADLSKPIALKVSENLSLDVEETVRDTLTSKMQPILHEVTLTTSQAIAQDMQRQHAEQIQEYELRRTADAQKIDQLTALVTNLSDTVANLASTQSQFQDGLLKIQQQISRDRLSAIHSQVPSQAPPSLQSRAPSYGSPAGSASNQQLVLYPGEHSSGKDAQLQEMIASIAHHMEQGDFETGLVRWIQLPRKDEVFDQYIVKYKPQIMQDLPALVSLSVASVLAENFDGPYLREKVGWVEVILDSLSAALPHITDKQVRGVVPKIMGNFIEQMDRLFIQIRNRNPSDPVLQHLTQMSRQATRIRDFAGSASMGY